MLIGYMRVSKANGSQATDLQLDVAPVGIRLETAIENATQMKQASEQRMRELQEDRDHWRRQATALLEDKRPQQQGLWGRLLKQK